MMERVSSQLTILLRIALPTIWFTSIVSVVVLLLWSVQGKAQLFSNPILWILLLFILVTGFLFIKFVLWRLYRVDMDEHSVYVTNYFRMYKYPFSDVVSIRESKTFPDRVFIIRLKARGSFGREIAFLASGKLWNSFVDEHPDLFVGLFNKED